MRKEEKDMKRQLAYEMYVHGEKYTDIAAEIGVTESAIKNWAKRYWNRVSVSKKEGFQKSKVSTKAPPKTKRGTRDMRGRNPASHHNGKGPPGNKNAEKHGFFSKVLPEETLELVTGIDVLSPIEVLWQNIQIQYAAILRAQRIMYVKDAEDTTKEIQLEGETTSYLIQTATDKQASFLTAQSRAMQSLGSMIKQYDDLMRSELATEEQKARIEVLKAKINQTSISDDLSKLDELLSGITKIAKGADDETDS